VLFTAGGARFTVPGMSIRRATTLGLALLLAAGLSFVLPSAPAGAYNPGVKSLHFAGTDDTCVAG
jgi:hypothetical protein